MESLLNIYNASELTGVKYRSETGDALNEYKYQYDLNGNIEKLIENGDTEEFAYDALNRIINSTKFNEKYSYDAKSNRKIIASTKLPESLQNKSYSYDTNNQLKSVKIGDDEISYRYNGDGLLYERVDGTKVTKYYYDGDTLIAEADIQNICCYELIYF